MNDAPATDTPVRITLRQLPLAAKLVLSVFLIAVGLGYFSALVQLHLKHSSKEGEALPTLDDVVEHFSGLRKPDPNEPPPVSKVEALITGDIHAPDVGAKSMVAAFLAKSKGLGKGANVGEREGERDAMLAWVRATPEAKKSAYEKDHFPLPPNHTLTADYRTDDKAGVKIRTLVNDRCAECHRSQGEVGLGTFADLEPLVTPPSREVLPGGYVRSSKQVSVEALTQSTHAHLLSFAVLFTLTGLTFAFTTYPAGVRGALAPIVLVAQVADVACWWLARVPDVGPYFAQTIVFTGGIVGSGLMLQIVLSLLNMYGSKGKAVVVLLFLLAAAGFGYLGEEVIRPALDAERAAARQPKDKPADVKPPPKPTESQLERLIMGPKEISETAKFNGKGTMAPAFFEKDSKFRTAITKRPRAEVEAEREAERRALVAWMRLDPEAREKAYEDDALPLPADLAGKPLTPDYVTEAKAVMVKSILNDRCAKCHYEGGDEAGDYPLETYEQIAKYIDGTKVAATGPAEIPPARD